MFNRVHDLVFKLFRKSDHPVDEGEKIDDLLPVESYAVQSADKTHFEFESGVVISLSRGHGLELTGGDNGKRVGGGFQIFDFLAEIQEVDNGKLETCAASEKLALKTCGTPPGIDM